MNKSRSILKTGLMAGLLALASAGVQAATVFCPNGLGGALSAPTSGRYVQVTNAANPGACYYQNGNLQNSDFPLVAAAAGVAPANFLFLDKNGPSSAIAQGSLTSIAGGSTSGNWSLTSNLWTSYSSLYLGFHFGGGQGSLDSFVVQLQNNMLSGTWSFNAVFPDALNGLSNYYLFGVAGNGNPPPNRIPEPGSLALVGAALLAAGALRRRFAN